MLRNLIYSFCFHVMFVAVFFITTFEVATKIIPINSTPLTINFLNENEIKDLENLDTDKEDDRVKNLTLEEKIDLYDKLENDKKEENSKDIENKEIDINNISSGSSREKEEIVEQAVEEKTSQKSNEDNKENEEELIEEQNEFSYHFTPVYVAEEKINTEEKRKLVENTIKREDLRKKIKERNAIPELNFDFLKTSKTINDIVKISQKPLVVAKAKKEKLLAKKEKEKTLTSEEKIENEENKIRDEIVKNNPEKMATFEALLDKLDSENKEEIRVEGNISGLNKDNIFNEQNITDLKAIEDSKNNKKYMLSLREKRNIKNQIKSCYKLAILRSKKDSKAIVSLTANVEKNGVINMTDVRVRLVADDFKDGYEIAIENAKSALIFCSPLRGLPSGKYRTWRQMTFVFDSNKLD